MTPLMTIPVKLCLAYDPCFHRHTYFNHHSHTPIVLFVPLLPLHLFLCTHLGVSHIYPAPLPIASLLYTINAPLCSVLYILWSMFYLTNPYRRTAELRCTPNQPISSVRRLQLTP